MINGVLRILHFLSLVTDVIRMRTLTSTHDGSEYYTGGIVAGESSPAHSGAVVYNQCTVIVL